MVVLIRRYARTQRMVPSCCRGPLAPHQHIPRLQGVWEEVRYQLELQYRMPQIRSFLMGTHLDERPLEPGEMISAEDVVVIRFYPQPRHFPSYVPFSVELDRRTQQELDQLPLTLSMEDRLIRRVMRLSWNYFYLQYDPWIKHPSDLAFVVDPGTQERRYIPPGRGLLQYTCIRCGKVGDHYQAQCQQEETCLVRNLTRGRILGIPKPLLEHCVDRTDPLGGLTMDGTWMKLRTEEPKPSESPNKQSTPEKRPFSHLEFDFEVFLPKDVSQQNVFRTNCIYFQRGICKMGDQCRFLHRVDRETQPRCQFFATGYCAAGKSCKFLHTQRKGERLICRKYAQGHCPEGPQCPHRHIKEREPLQPEQCCLPKELFEALRETWVQLQRKRRAPWKESKRRRII